MAPASVWLLGVKVLWQVASHGGNTRVVVDRYVQKTPKHQG